MSLENKIKVNHLLKNWPIGTVSLSSWLAIQGISHQLLNRYKKSKWLESIGSGAAIRTGDKVDYLGGLYAPLQTQAPLTPTTLPSDANGIRCGFPWTIAIRIFMKFRFYYPPRCLVVARPEKPDIDPMLNSLWQDESPLLQ